MLCVFCHEKINTNAWAHSLEIMIHMEWSRHLKIFKQLWKFWVKSRLKIHESGLVSILEKRKPRFRNKWLGKGQVTRSGRVRN